MADGDLRTHHVDEIIQIGAVVHIRQQCAVHILVFLPVGAVHVRHVEIIALVAPPLIEDLAELLFRLQVHSERHVQASLPGLRRIAIGIDKEQSGRDLFAAAARAASAAAAAAGAV